MSPEHREYVRQCLGGPTPTAAIPLDAHVVREWLSYTEALEAMVADLKQESGAFRRGYEAGLLAHPERYILETPVRLSLAARERIRKELEDWFKSPSRVAVLAPGFRLVNISRGEVVMAGEEEQTK